MARAHGGTQALAWLHTWTGLVGGWLLFWVCVTGALSVFHHEIDHWMQPELRAQAASPQQALTVAEDRLRRDAADASFWSIELPAEAGDPVAVSWRNAGGTESLFLDPLTGDALAPRETEGGEFFVELHYSFHAPPVGIWIVAATGMVMLIAAISGTLIHKRLFKDFFTFRPGASLQRSWLDAHNAAGVLVLPFHLMIAYTGLVSTAWVYMPAAFDALYDGDIQTYFTESARIVQRPSSGPPAPLAQLSTLHQQAIDLFEDAEIMSVLVMHPNRSGATVQFLRTIDDQLALAASRVTFDGRTGETLQVIRSQPAVQQVYSVLAGLHYARFGGAAARWLYFVLGSLSAFVVASGLLVFVAKRRRRHAAQTPPARAAIERVNVAAVMAPLLAIAAYLWSNRLLPAGLPERADWEVWTFFAALALALLHGLARPSHRGWIEQISMLSMLCLLLPLLNLTVPGMHFVEGHFHPDWARAAVDITALLFGLVFALTAIKLRKARKEAGDGTDAALSSRRSGLPG